MLRTLKRFGLFCLDFVVGDDWTLVVIVVVALLAAWGLSNSGFAGWIVLMVVVLGGLGLSVARAHRAARRNSHPASP